MDPYACAPVADRISFLNLVLIAELQQNHSTAEILWCGGLLKFPGGKLKMPAADQKCPTVLSRDSGISLFFLSFPGDFYRQPKF